MKLASSIRLFVLGAGIVLLSPLVTADHRGNDVHVVRRMRVGNNIEDITFIATGKHRGRVAAMNGWDVIATTIRGDRDADRDDEDSANTDRHGSSRDVEKLFDVRDLGIGVNAPRGMEFVPTQKRFYFSSTTDPDRLFVADEDGRPLSPLRLTYPAGVDPLAIFQFEGLGYIPQSSAFFPDHLLAITLRLPYFNSVIEIIRFDRVRGRIVGGTIVHEVTFDTTSPLYQNFFGVQHVGDPDRLIITTATGNDVWVVNYDGTFTGPVATIADANDVEGLASLPDGRIALADYGQAKLILLDHGFTRLPEEQYFGVGIGVSRLQGLAWKPDTQEFLTTSARVGVPWGDIVTAFTLRGTRQFQADDPRILVLSDVAYVPAVGGDPARVAVANYIGFFSGIFIDDADGNYVSRIQTRGVITPTVFSRPQALAALPGGRFAYSNFSIFPTLEVITAGASDPADPTSVFASEVGRIVLDAGETPQHPAQVGVGLSFLDVSGGVIFSGNSFYDLNGNRLAQFDTSALGLTQINGGTLITSGPFAGHLAVVESDSSTLVIFRFELVE